MILLAAMLVPVSGAEACHCWYDQPGGLAGEPAAQRASAAFGTDCPAPDPTALHWRSASSAGTKWPLRVVNFQDTPAD
jgi:hypothetical protein